MAKKSICGEFYCYSIQNKSVAEAHTILVETYSNHALSETTCRHWFRHFKNNDFDIEGKEGVLAHQKSLRTKDWRYYFMKTHVRC